MSRVRFQDPQTEVGVEHSEASVGSYTRHQDQPQPGLSGLRMTDIEAEFRRRVEECSEDSRCNQCRCIEECEKSKSLVDRALNQMEVQPCLWLRGILPKSWTQVSPPPEPAEEMKEYIGEFDHMDHIECLVAAGDVSGGEFYQDPRLRRIAWGWIVLNIEGA